MRALILLLTLLLIPGCDFCWPPGGSPQPCRQDDDDDVEDDDDGGEDDDDVEDDDDSAGDDDDTSPDDDDVGPDPCALPRTRPASFDAVDPGGYGTVTSDSAQPPAWCWYDAGIDWDETVDMSSAGATHGFDTFDWEMAFYGEVVDTVRIDVNGAVNFEYQSARNPNNSCAFYESWDSAGVAGFWDDLNMTADGAGTIRYGLAGEEPHRVAVAWWDQVFHDDFQGDPLSFQVHLFEGDQHVEVHYLDVVAGDWDVDDGRSATIGLRHAQAELFSCDDDNVRDGFSIAFWPPEAR